MLLKSIPTVFVLFMVLGTPVISMPSDIESERLHLTAINDYASGQYRSAINKFQQLLKVYQQDDDRYHEISILMAYALDQLGYPRRACTSLLEIIEADPFLCHLDQSSNQALTGDLKIPASRNHIIATITLSNLMRDFGKFDQAIALLDIASERARQLNDEQLIAGTQIGYGDVLFTKLKLQRDRLTFQEERELSTAMIKEIRATFDTIYQHFEAAQNTSLDREAKTKWIAAFLERQRWQTYLSSEPNLEQLNAVNLIFDALMTDELTDLPPIEQASHKLDISKHLYDYGILLSDRLSLRFSFSLAAEALEIAESLEKDETLTQIYGHIGDLYSRSGQDPLAFGAYNRASRYATTARLNLTTNGSMRSQNYWQSMGNEIRQLAIMNLRSPALKRLIGTLHH